MLYNKMSTPVNHTQSLSEWANTTTKRKWCDIKEQSPDTIILVHVGKFYEVFHQDADALVNVTDAPYMKGVVAHTGFPSSALNKYIGVLREAGYLNIRII